VFRWTPNETQGGTNYLITIIATDDGVPSLSATQSFAATVIKALPSFSIAVGTTAVLSNGTGNVALTLHSRADVTSLHLVLAARNILPPLPNASRLTNFTLSALGPQVGSASLSALSSNRVDILMSAQPSAFLQGDFVLGQLDFAAVPDAHSAVVLLEGESLTGQRQSGLPGDGTTTAGRVFVVGREPILDSALGSSNRLALMLYALPGRNYALERTPTLGAGQGWTFDSTIIPSALRTDLPLRPMTAASEFFRAYEQVLLSIWIEGNNVVIEWPLDCPTCRLEEAPALGANVNWIPSSAQPILFNGHYRVVLPMNALQRFMRLTLP
jgi:hypothetical protein